MRGKCKCGWEGIVNGKGQCMSCEYQEEHRGFEKFAIRVLLTLAIIAGTVLFFSYETLVLITLYLMG